MADKEPEPENNDTPIFNQVPDVSERHPVNYMMYLGDCMRNYRDSLGRPESGAEYFATHTLGKYVDKPISRNRIARAEKGVHTVEWSVVAAYISEMGLWPEIINAASHGKIPTLRYMHLVRSELNPDIRAAMDAAHQKLKDKRQQEMQR
jgi:hypothetical protein